MKDLATDKHMHHAGSTHQQCTVYSTFF